MQEEDRNETGLFVASIMSRVRDLKSKYKNEDNITDELNLTKISADTTGMWHVCYLYKTQELLVC
uniref:Uncharacterized protein n=1 Tax=Varanus komodoensis TaxID=61221 RepID=A0A8D2Q9C3_VARKO